MPTSENVYSVENWGTETSKPLIHLTGEGTIACDVNGNTVFKYTFPKNDTEVMYFTQKHTFSLLLCHFYSNN